MRIFDSSHIEKGEYFTHLKRAGAIAGLFLGSGMLGLIHAIFPFFLPEFMSRANNHIREKLENYA